MYKIYSVDTLTVQVFWVLLKSSMMLVFFLLLVKKSGIKEQLKQCFQMKNILALLHSWILPRRNMSIR